MKRRVRVLRTLMTPRTVACEREGLMITSRYRPLIVFCVGLAALAGWIAVAMLVARITGMPADLVVTIALLIAGGVVGPRLK